MTACSCEIIGNEDCKMLVTIQYRRVNSINNQHLEFEVKQFSHSAPDPHVVTKDISEKPGNFRIIYFSDVDSFVSHLTKFI